MSALFLKIRSLTNFCYFFRDCYVIPKQILYLPGLQSNSKMQNDNHQDSSQHSAQKCTESTSCNLNKNIPLEFPQVSIDANQKMVPPPTTFTLDCQSKVIDHISKSFYKIDVKQIEQFCMTLFPVSLSKNVYEGLDLGIKSFYQIKKKGVVSFEDVKNLLIKKGEQYSAGIKEALEQLYSEPSYSKYLEIALAKYYDNASKEVIDLQDLTKQPTRSVTSTKSLQPKKVPNSQKSGRTQRSDSKLNLNANTNSNFESDMVINLADRGICICEKEVMPQEDTFVCVHCGFSYHLQCMKKEVKLKHCSFCHLKKIVPNKQTKRTLFIGLMRKGRRRHQFTINIPEEDLQLKLRLQIRCFRMKDATQNFVLFPDFTDITINNFSIKEFRPLHRQSSLKYRKDQPFYAEFKHLVPKQNRVVISQKLPCKDLKDSRIETQNHLIGFFMVEEKKIDALIRQIATNSMTVFEESKKILDSAFIQFSGADGVSCEVVKIPLTCTLTTQKLVIPVRGLFCTHYQCFDLSNFMKLTSLSANPRWVCPLCKLPCYMFKVDCILMAILNEYEAHAPTEVMFFKTGDFSVYTGENLVKQKINNIHSLPIESIAKRAAIQALPQPQKKKKKPFVIPQESKVISLDLD